MIHRGDSLMKWDGLITPGSPRSRLIFKPDARSASGLKALSGRRSCDFRRNPWHRRDCTLDRGPTAESPRPVPPDCLSHEDAAQFLGIPPRSLSHLVKSRKIRFVQIGDQRGRVFRIEDLRSYATENMVRTAHEMLAK